MKTLCSVHCPLMIVMTMNRVLPILSHIRRCLLEAANRELLASGAANFSKESLCFHYFIMLPMRDEDAST